MTCCQIRWRWYLWFDLICETSFIEVTMLLSSFLSRYPCKSVWSCRWGFDRARTHLIHAHWWLVIVWMPGVWITQTLSRPDQQQVCQSQNQTTSTGWSTSTVMVWHWALMWLRSDLHSWSWPQDLISIWPFAWTRNQLMPDWGECMVRSMTQQVERALTPVLSTHCCTSCTLLPFRNQGLCVREFYISLKQRFQLSWWAPDWSRCLGWNTDFRSCRASAVTLQVCQSTGWVRWCHWLVRSHCVRWADSTCQCGVAAWSW